MLRDGESAPGQYRGSFCDAEVHGPHFAANRGGSSRFGSPGVGGGAQGKEDKDEREAKSRTAVQLARKTPPERGFCEELRD